VTDNVHMAHIW